MCVGAGTGKTAGGGARGGASASWPHQAEESWAQLAGTMLVPTSHHLPGTQLHPTQPPPCPFLLPRAISAADSRYALKAKRHHIEITLRNAIAKQLQKISC